jgi:hypothetical protein
MLRSELLAAIRHEIYRHDWSHFVDDPPSLAQGGNETLIALSDPRFSLLLSEVLRYQLRQFLLSRRSNLLYEFEIRANTFQRQSASKPIPMAKLSPLSVLIGLN